MRVVVTTHVVYRDLRVMIYIYILSIYIYIYTYVGAYNIHIRYVCKIKKCFYIFSTAEGKTV